MKIIAYYLPQYHAFPENDAWWGKGFTEWVNVKKAKPLFKGHAQPRVPLNQNYYNLLDEENKTLRWQADLAQKHGIYGFCYYHYWFDGHMLMQKPMENMLADKEIHLPFCVCWANEDWTKAWAKKSREVLIGQTYGDEGEWKRHFEYLLPFFQDSRYIKIDGKPLFILYRPEIVPPLEAMLLYWKKLAKEHGFPGIAFCHQHVWYDHTVEKTGYLFDYGIEYQPAVVREQTKTKSPALMLHKSLNILFNTLNLPSTKASTIVYDYDKMWQMVLNHQPKDNRTLPGAFVDWDNTPRYGKGASVYRKATPEKFKHYLAQQIQHARNDYKKDMLFMFAWNEWGEGGYLEPDEQNRYGMLEAVRDALSETGEFPEYPTR